MFKQVNSDLENISKAIEIKSGELELAREKYLEGKAGYERAFAYQTLVGKANNPEATQADLKAKATVETFVFKMEMLKLQSVYRKLAGELRALRDKLDALREHSYNLRAESKL